MKIVKNKYLWATFCGALLSANPSGVVAAPGTLADSPLFLSSAVQPNIFFLIDDSGSMDWEVLKTNEALTLYEACDDVNPDPANCLDSGFRNRWNLDISPTDTDPDELLEHCVGYNVMAYDPRRLYTPWVGENDVGTAFSDQALTSALVNPYLSSGGAVNLTLADGGGDPPGYIPWNDDGDGVFERGECGDARVGATVTVSYANFVPATSIPATPAAADNLLTPMVNEEFHSQTNFANWYSYYRKREFVAKRALSAIISTSTSRMGLATLHDNDRLVAYSAPAYASALGVGTEILDVDDITLPVDPTAQQNKEFLLNQLFNIDSSGGTPLRVALRNTGNYFMGSGTVGDLFGGKTPTDDPILSEANGGSCQQNFTILMSDGFWNGSTSPAVGNTDTDGSGPWDGGAYADGVSNTLADVAMHYYETDLDPSLDADVPAIQGIDTNNEQHMVTYTVAFGVNGSLSAGPAPGAGSFAWPTPVSDTLTTIDDMRHAAYNGRGLFLNAGDPDTLISSLNSAINDIQGREGTAAAVSFNSTSVQADSLVFQASFNSEGWHGNLRAFSLDAQGNTTLAWDAASLLDARDLGASPRQIVTYNGTNGVPLTWPANYVAPNVATDMSAAQIADLLVNAPTPSAVATDTAHGQDLIAYLRGDAANEGSGVGQFRPRDGHRLGDIVHSSPVFVGTPNIPYPDDLEGVSNLYSTFKTAHANRPGRVYVGANDGMLHVFDSDGVGIDGDEVFAYMPGLVFSTASGEGIHSLAENGYNHKYYVDLSPSVADVFVNNAWATVLVGGLRGGGKGIFALDVTDPSQLTEATPNAAPMFEYTHPDLGYTFSEIQFGRFEVAPDTYKWAAVFGNGYNNDPSGDGEAKLFIVYLDGTTPTILETQAGVLAASKSCSDAASDCNGLSTPALADLNGDVTVDRIYAGDLHGNMWVFDVTGGNPASWGAAYKDALSNPIPLVKACSGTCASAADRQPITSKPALSKHPTRGSATTDPNIMIYFGTGQYLATNDNSSSDTQSFYGVWDGGTYGLAPLTTSLDRTDLVMQAFSESSPDQRTGTSNSVNYQPAALTAELGWYIDLPVSGERVVVNPAVLGSIVFFNTLIPSTSSCSGGGDGWLMNVDALTGGMPGFAVVDVNNDGDFSNDPVIGGSKIGGVPAASRFIISDKNKLLRVTPDSKGNLSAGAVRSGANIRSRRISWTHLEY